MSEDPRDLRQISIISHADGGYNRKRGLEQVNRAAEAAGIPHYILNNIQQLDRALAQSAEQATSLLVVNAGDGTVSKVIEKLRTVSMFTREPVLALLRGGTTNMIHKDVGFRERPGAALETLLTAVRNGRMQIETRRPLVIKPPQEEVHYGFFFATNAVVRGIVQARDQFHRQGVTGGISEIASVLRMLGKLLLKKVENDPVLAPVPMGLSVDSMDRGTQQQVFLVAFTLRQLILGLRPLRNGQQSALAVLPSPYSLGLWIKNFVSGKLDEFDSLELHGDFAWILDGEMYDHSSNNGPLRLDLAEPVRFLTTKH